jgi:hypothetical protein
MNYNVGDFINCQGNILRLDKVDELFYYFFVIENKTIIWYEIKDGLYAYSRELLLTLDKYSRKLTDEEKLQLL